jgi:hypothetical protein
MIQVKEHPAPRKNYGRTTIPSHIIFVYHDEIIHKKQTHLMRF